jgi:hypothetical protein
MHTLVWFLNRYCFLAADQEMGTFCLHYYPLGGSKIVVPVTTQQAIDLLAGLDYSPWYLSGGV